MNPLGTHLYGTNHMSLGLSQLGSQIYQLQNQNQSGTNSILRLGSAGAAKFEHLIPPLTQSSFGHSPQSLPNSSPFFMNDPNQAFEENQSQQGPLSSKQLHGLMQLPDLQGNNNNSNSAPSNLFNLSFFPNSNSTGTIIPDQFNNISGGGNNQGTTTLYNINNNPVSDQVGSGLSSLFGNSSVQHENMSPHMSATALLQKAAQMGSTTTTNNGSSLLRGICGSSTNNGAKSERELVSDHIATFGSDHRRGEGIRSSMENDHHHLHGLISSIADGNTTSIFGNVQGNDDDNLGQFHNLDESNTKLPQNLGVSFGGSDKLTLDFLGVGGMVRNMSSAFSQREQQQQQQQQQRVMSTMSSLDRDLKSAQSSHHFGSSTLQ